MNTALAISSDPAQNAASADIRSGRERDLPFAPGFFTDQTLLFTGAKIACDQIPDDGKAKGGNFLFF